MKRALCLLFGVMLVVNIAQAREIADVKLQEKIDLPNGQALVLNGAGIRYKLFFKIYVAALYLPTAVHTPKGVLDEPGPKRMLMHFLYHKVTREQMQDGWNDGFSDNLDAKTYKSLQPRIQQFNNLFTDLKSGDRVWLDYEPGVGTQVAINGQKQGMVPGEDFMRALFSVWLGPEPPGSALKRELLGQGGND